MSVINCNCVDGMRNFGDATFDSVVCDPPYELGFMGKSWDASGIAYSIEMWREALRVLKPGGHLLAFSGSRTYHRMACAIEDAGFEVRDQIMWVYGSGFPKSHNLAGDHEGWGTALKPAHEPICVARKPLIGTVAANMVRYGVGAINIAASRVDAEIATGRWPANLIHDGSDEVLQAFPDAGGQLADVSQSAPSPKTSTVYGAMQRAGADNVGTVGFKMKPGARRLDIGSAARFFYCAKASKADRDEGLEGFEVKASAAMQGNLIPGQRLAGNGMPIAVPKRANTHPTVKPTTLMRYLCRLVTPPGGWILDPFAGSGSTGKAAKLEGFFFLGFELSTEYANIANARIDNTKGI